MKSISPVLRLTMGLAACLAFVAGGASRLSGSDLRYYELKTHTVAGVKPGGGVVVKTREGDTYKGRFLEREGATVSILDRDGLTRTFEWSELSWVRARAKGFDDLSPISFGGGDDDIEPESDEAVDAR